MQSSFQIKATPAQTIFCFVRPGVTEDNYLMPGDAADTSRWSNGDASPLSKEGIATAKIAAEAFSGQKFDGVYAAKTRRAFETAQHIVGKELQINFSDILEEMRIGYTAGKSPKEIVDWFKGENHYPDGWFHEETKKPLPWAVQQFPRLLAKRGGGELQPNDVFLDPWNPEMDSFDAFSADRIDRLRKLALDNLGKVILLVPSGTPMKAVIAEAEGVTSDRVNCDKKGCYFVAVFDESGKVTLLKERSKGVSID